MVESIYHAALEQDPDRRVDFVKQVCYGDATLEQQVLSLLAETEGDASLPKEEAGSHPVYIGHYRLIRILGEGGMGTVYEAEQEEPRRTVALKVIRPGLATPEGLRRFKQESLALGRLQHPGIAQIYEASTADTGFGPQPYFAMELIRGCSLDTYAEKHAMTTRQKLVLTAKICEAVHHAHQRGLIHRDLKPGNILIDQTGQPKILDFGVARITDSDAQPTLLTEIGQIVGTLAYMSPEQVLGDPLELDTRSDVYMLGVILFELLAGRPPYKIAPRLPEAIQTIREQEVALLGSVSRSYRGDIETIVAKALRKDKTRRYASAADMAADIRCYLKDEPIAARPPTIGYHLQKFVRKYRTLVGAVSAVFLVLVGAVILSTAEARRARTAERNALNEAANASAVTEFLRDVLSQAGAKAQARLDITPDPGLKVRTALDRAAVRIAGRFPGRPVVEASIQQTMGETYEQLGLFREAQQHLERAIDLRRHYLGVGDPATLSALFDLAFDLYRYQGDYPRSEALFIQILEARRRTLGEQNPQTLDTMGKLGDVYRYEGKYAEAEPLLSKAADGLQRLGCDNCFAALDAKNDLALLYQSQGRTAEAEALFATALDGFRRQVGDEHPETLNISDNLAVLYRDEGKYAQAEPLLSKVVEVRRRVLGDEHMETRRAMHDLAVLYVREGEYAKAELLYSKLLEVQTRLWGTEHPNTLTAMSSLAHVYREEGKFEPAKLLLTKVIEMRRRSLGDERVETRRAMHELAVLYVDEGEYTKAEPLYTRLLEMQTRLSGSEHPDTLTAMANLAQLYRREGNYAQAEPLLTRVLEVRRRVLGNDDPKTLMSMKNLAILYQKQRRYAPAESLLGEVLNNHQHNAWERYHCQSLLGASLAGEKKFAEAEPLLISGYEGMTLQSKVGISRENQLDLKQAGEWIIGLYQDWRQPEKAKEWRAKLQYHRPLGDHHVIGTQ